MGLASLPLKHMLIGYMWQRLTPTLIFALCYASGVIAILLSARFISGLNL
jgi:hypothetical protein